MLFSINMNMLRNKIKLDFVSAFKAREIARTDALRTIEAALKQVEVDTRKELIDDDVVKILRSELKKREEAIVLFVQGNRQDLAEKETFEAELIKSYLPAQMSIDEVTKYVDQAISELGENANFGQVMQKTMGLVAGKTDGKVVSEVVKSKLIK